MKIVLTSLLSVFLIVQAVSAQNPTGVVYKTMTPPVIDGQIDEIWNKVVQYNIDIKFKNGQATFGENGTTYWKALWDDAGMYILVVANDDAWYPYWITEAGSIWEYDKAELYFDTNSILKDGLGCNMENTGHCQIAPNPQKGFTDGTKQYDYYGKKLEYAYKVFDPSWNVEYFIPWNSIPDNNGQNFDISGTMGFDITLVDRDPGDGARKSAQWANENVQNGSWNNMDDAGHLTFGEPVAIEGENQKQILAGESAQLSAIVNFINPGALTYSWSPAEGLSQTDIPDPIVTVQKDITYTLTVNSSNGYIGKATVSILAIPLTAAASDLTISCGDVAQLDVSTNYTGTGNLTYNWQPAAELDNPTVKNPVATIEQTTDFMVTVTTPNGAVAEKNVRVNVIPLTATAFDQTISCGDVAQLDVSTNYAGTGNLTYNWQPTDGLDNPTVKNPVATIERSTDFKVTVTTPKGTVAEKDVRINVIPLTVMASDQTITCGNAAQLDVLTNYAGTGKLTYNWQPAAGLDNPTVKNPVATIDRTTDFKVTVTTPKGTVAEKSVHVDVSKINYQPELCLVSVDAHNKNVLVWSQPGDTAIQDYLIFRESLIQTDFYDLIGSVSSSEETIYTDETSNALVQSNKYKIAARDNCGFVTSQSIPHKTMHLSINKGQGNSWNLIWEPYDGFKVSSYKIYRGSSEDNMIQIGSTAGSANSYSDFTANVGDVYYQIEVLAPSPCNALKSTAYTSTRSNVASNIYEAISSEITKEDLRIFPVPVKDELHVNRDLSCIFEMVVLSIDGRVELSFKQPVANESINVSSLSRGVHLLKIADSDGISIQKFIKE
jgi:hypothetical protein